MTKRPRESFSQKTDTPVYKKDKTTTAVTIRPRNDSRGPLRQRERDQLSAVDAAHGDDDVLLAVDHVGHRRSGLLVRHLDGADVGTGGLVIRAEQCDAVARFVTMNAAFAGDQQRLRRERSDERAAGLAKTGQRQALQGGMILDVIRRRAVRLLPCEITSLHVERRDPVVGRLDERQTLHGRASAPTASRTNLA